jgi:cell division protein ZapE
LNEAAALASPTARYREGIRTRQWHDDPAQASALAALDCLQQELLCRQPAPRRGFLARMRSHFTGRVPRAPQGLYLFGPVGRGKTFLMDLFVASLPAGMAQRRHFHRFMGEIHAALKARALQADPLPAIAADIGRCARVLCLDEFLIEDIGDAMILAGLLRGLFAHNIVLVTTSNTPPSALYRDGLQRARFEPAIALLEQHCRVLELASEHDWRLRRLDQAQIYQHPPGREAERVLTRLFHDYARGNEHEGGSVAVHNRPIAVRRRADNIVWFDFDALCEGPRSRADYTDLAARYPAVIVSGVPIFTPDNHDPATRFIHLVDAFYDQRVKLVLSAAAPIVELYEGERLRAQFARTESRLIEMGTREYLALPHANVGADAS